MLQNMSQAGRTSFGWYVRHSKTQTRGLKGEAGKGHSIKMKLESILLNTKKARRVLHVLL